MATDNLYGPDHNFGYQYAPGLAAEYSHQSEDPAKAFYSGSMSPDQRIPTFSTTNWDGVDITAIATLIYHQHDGPYRQASLTWYKITLHLGHLKTQLQQSGGKLAAGWDPAKNDAAGNFFHYVGAATWSMDEWITFALQNRDATLAVAGAINKARTEMTTLFAGYRKDYVEVGDPLPLSGNIYQRQHIPIDPNTGKEVDLDAIKKNYDNKARAIIKELAGVYASNWGALNEGHRFQGPTTAASPATALENRMPEILANLRKGLPGGGAGMPGPMNQQQIQAAQAQLADQLAQQQLAMDKALRDAARAADAARQAALQQQQQLALQQKALGQVPTFPPIQVGQPGAPGALPLGVLPRFGLGPLAGTAASGPGTAGFRGGPAGLGNFDLTADGAGFNRGTSDLLGRTNLSGAGGGMPGMPGGSGLGRGMGNPGLRGRLGAPGGPGAPGNPGSRSPLGGRKGRDGDRDQARTTGFRPDSEEYLADTPTAPGGMTARLAGTSMAQDGLTPPPGGGMPGMPGRPGIPGQRGGPGQPGLPGQPGAPGSGGPGRSVKKEDLAGRRQRTADAEANEDLMAPPLLLRPDLTGRKGLPVIDWDQVSGPEMGAERAMLGSRGAPSTGPGMADRLAGRRKDKEKEKPQARPEQERSEDATDDSELWTVATPETIEAPNQTKVDEQRGRALGST